MSGDVRKSIKYRRVAKLLDSTWAKTRIMEDHLDEVQIQLKEFAAEAQCGEPLAAFYQDSDSWTLLTTTHLAWSTPGSSVNQLPFEKVSEINLTSEDSSRVIRDGSVKGCLDRLQVTSDEGEEFLIMMERGAPFYQFWKVINLLALSPFGMK